MGMDEEETEVGKRRPSTPEVKLPLTPRRSEEMVDDSKVDEPQQKAARRDPASSPSSLHKPYFAGDVRQVQHPVNDEPWEEEMESFIDHGATQDWDPLDIDALDEGCPPEVSEEELRVIEEAAVHEEIHRLLQMGVLRDPTEEELMTGDILTTRSVFDWRVRERKWKRRCRFVAREFRGSDGSTSKTFAPTSSLSGTRLLLSTHVLLGWKIMFVDIKDAFLLVRQQKLVLVEQPDWWNPKGDLEMGRKRYWTLARCLPGQRDAAARWYEFLADNLMKWGFKSHLSLPSLFRHETKAIAAVCHVDDLIIAGEVESLEWLLSSMKDEFTLSESGILPRADQSEEEAVRCLKKRRYFTKDGIVIMPHEKYIPALVELYGLEKKAGKATPESMQVELEGSSDELLEGADQFRFRSALGTLLYVSQDRVDIQHCIRNLSQFMARPTRKAEMEIKHAIL